MKNYSIKIAGKDLILFEKDGTLGNQYFNYAAVKRLNELLHNEFKNGKSITGEKIINEDGSTLEIENFKETSKVIKKIEREHEVRVQKSVLIGTAATVTLGVVLAFALSKNGGKEVLPDEVTITEENPKANPSDEEIQQLLKEHVQKQVLTEIERLKKIEEIIRRNTVIDPIPEPEPIVEPTEEFEIKLSEYEDILPVGDTKNVIINIDGIPNNYDEELDRKVERYDDIIKDAAERAGLPEDIIKDPIKQESSGGDGNNIMQIEEGAWLDQEISCYDYKEQRFTSYVLTEHPENHQRIKNIITPAMLNDPYININFGANALKWCIVNSRNNLPVGITLYNGGWHEVMEKTIPNTAKALGITTNEVLDNESDLTFLNYIDYPAGWGDKEYFQHVMGKATNENTVNYDGYVYINRNGEKCTKNYEINLTRLKKY